MKYKHVDKNGNETKLKDLGLNHLYNIISYIKRKAKDGITVRYGSGFCAEDMWYDEETIYGKKVKDYFNYYEYKKELKKRNKKIN